MKNRYLILGATLVNDGIQQIADVLVVGDRITRIGSGLVDSQATIVEAAGAYLLPGIIDTHVHFREPGATHKGSIAKESYAAVCGGVTSYLEMPNTQPPTTTYAALEDKLGRAAKDSWANYGFYLGASRDNLDEILAIPQGMACGLKLFMGSSTGGLLVDEPNKQEAFFARYEGLIAVHAEDEALILAADQGQRKKDPLPTTAAHPLFRPRAACLKASRQACAMAKSHGARLHILHVSTQEELALFSPDTNWETKTITGEACMHHLCFDSSDYASLGNLIKVNPAIKEKTDKEALWQALANGQLDTIGSDHAPHTREEKKQPYLLAPSGAPMVGHTLLVLLEASAAGRLSLEQLVTACCHAPARRYQMTDRGFLREGYYADLVLVKKTPVWTLSGQDVHSHCGWSPLEGQRFHHRIAHVFVSGTHLLAHGRWQGKQPCGQRLCFNTP